MSPLCLSEMPYAPEIGSVAEAANAAVFIP
jgi:hypothetical protein